MAAGVPLSRDPVILAFSANSPNSFNIRLTRRISSLLSSLVLAGCWVIDVLLMGACELAEQELAAPIHPPLGGGNREREKLRDAGQRPLLPVVQDQHGLEVPRKL